tara:strand:- start:923 stop:1216 length:294 start_codon:yes stop_codon:yes gene_type:complete
MTEDLVKRLRDVAGVIIGAQSQNLEEDYRLARDAADRIEELEQACAHATELDAILADRFRRSCPIEEKLLAAGMGKAPLPTKEECLQWAVKLGIPAP